MRTTARYSLLGAAVAGLGLAAFAFVTTRAQSTVPAAAAPQGADRAVVAKVGEEIITADELDTALGAGLARLEQQVYDMRRQQLEAMIAQRLLVREAARQGVTLEALLAREVAEKVEPVTDADVDAFFEANKARLPNQPNIKDQIRAYLAEQREMTIRDALVDRLRAATPVETLLPRPAIRRASVDIDGAPSRGPADAPVTLIEFTDFHCPFCRQVQPTLTRLLERYGDRVRHVFKDLPLDGLHPNARRAAEAARCAQDQGRFWEYRERLFASGTDVADATLTSIAQQLGLDVTSFGACLADGRHRAAIQRDVDEATRLGANGTPAFFINGRMLSGAQPFEAFVQVIDEELAEVR